MMSIHNYWSMPNQDQSDIRQQAFPKALASSMRVIEKRSAPVVSKPGGYTCKCRLADAGQCYADMHTKHVEDGKACDCSCHSDCGGNW